MASQHRFGVTINCCGQPQSDGADSVSPHSDGFIVFSPALLLSDSLQRRVYRAELRACGFCFLGKGGKMNSRNGQLENQIISIVLIILSVLTLTRGWIKITSDMDSSISSTVKMLIREINDEIEDADSEDRPIYRQVKGIVQSFKDGKLSPLEIVKISGRFVRGNQLVEKYYDDTFVDEDILLKFKIVLFAGIVWMLVIVGLAVLIIIDKRKNILYQWLFFGANALLVIVMIVMCIFLNQSDSDVSDFIYDNLRRGV